MGGTSLKPNVVALFRLAPARSFRRSRVASVRYSTRRDRVAAAGYLRVSGETKTLPMRRTTAEKRNGEVQGVYGGRGCKVVSV